MEAVIINYRRGAKTQTMNQMVLDIPGVDNKEKAEKLVGKKVSWKSPGGKELIGKVSAPHGRIGHVRVLWQTGMPGQAIGTKVKIE